MFSDPLSQSLIDAATRVSSGRNTSDTCKRINDAPLDEARKVLDADAVRKIFKKVGVVKDLKDNSMTFTDTTNTTIAEILFKKVIDIDIDMLNKAVKSAFSVKQFKLTLTPKLGGPLEFFIEVNK